MNDASFQALKLVNSWLCAVAELDMDEIVADGGITAAMVVQQEAANQQRRVREIIAREIAALTANPSPDNALREAAQAVLDNRSSTYTARNGRQVGVQGDDSEKVWLVHSDFITELEGALARAALSASAGGGETGWLIEESFGGNTHWIALNNDERWPIIKTLRSPAGNEIDKYLSPVRRVNDANDALRFARKSDAEAFITLFDGFLLRAEAAEHMWPAARSLPQAPRS